METHQLFPKIYFASSSFTYILLGLTAGFATICAFNLVYTTIAYHFIHWRFTRAHRSKLQSTSGFGKGNAEHKPDTEIQPMRPPLYPYSLPWLGSALSFLTDHPGQFWRVVQAQFTRFKPANNVQAMTIVLGGNKTHILASPEAIQGLFKNRALNRRRFNHDVQTKAMGLNHKDDLKANPWFYGKEGLGVDEHKRGIWDQYLLNATAVNELTRNFTAKLQQKFDDFGSANAKSQQEGNGDWKTTNLVEYIKDHMLTASTVALFGTKILEMNAKFAEEYWDFDNLLLARFYRVPKFMAPRAYQALDQLLDSTEKWIKHVMKVYGEDIPEDSEWDELLGSRATRARQKMFQAIGLSPRGIATFHIAFLFGLSSNAIPATSWTLAHLLAPENSDVLKSIRAEVETAKRPDGSIDINVLNVLPHLNSAFNETLRLYVDLLVTRDLHTDITLDGYYLKKGEIVMAPTFLGHRDPEVWCQNGMPPEHVWCAERFLKEDEKGEVVFSTSGTAGKFFPFGGGSHICPGRAFAKQEVLSAIATFLLTFEIEFLEYTKPAGKKGGVDGIGTEPSGFPIVKRQYAGNGVVQMEGDMRVRMRLAGTTK